MNIALAVVAALGFHLVSYLPSPANQWAALNLKNALIINAVLAVFNLFPLPPPRWWSDRREAYFQMCWGNTLRALSPMA